MLITSLTLQDARRGRASALINRLSAIASSTRFRRLRGAVAYATRSGCESAVASLQRNCRGWQSLRKLWLVSIDYGTTESEALQLLSQLPNSEVRIPDGAELLAHGLFPRRCFHPKTFIFDSGTDAAEAPFGLFVGSGNLTLSGLNAGVEHAISLLWLPPLRGREVTMLESSQSELSWWTEAWESASPVSRDFLTQYRRIRPTRPREDETPSVRSFSAESSRDIDTSPGIAWTNANCFWIQTNQLYKNRGAGNPGNQLDLKRGTRVYFGFRPASVPQNTVLGKISLQYDDLRPRRCGVRFGDNSMDKVNLPIPGIDGPGSYDNAVVHFERTGRKRFRVTLGDQLNLETWKARSRNQGLLYRLAGGREFGFYS